MSDEMLAGGRGPGGAGALLRFLIQDRLAQLQDWAYQPCRAELRQALEALIQEAIQEAHQEELELAEQPKADPAP